MAETTIVGAPTGAFGQRPRAVTPRVTVVRRMTCSLLAAPMTAVPPGANGREVECNADCCGMRSEPREVPLSRKGLSAERHERVEHAVTEREAAVGWIDRAAERAVDPDWISRHRAVRARKAPSRS